jgi:hypothetical protein
MLYGNFKAEVKEHDAACGVGNRVLPELRVLKCLESFSAIVSDYRSYTIVIKLSLEDLLIDEGRLIRTQLHILWLRGMHMR